MGRRLPPGEAERRAAERKRAFFAGEKYQKYDPKKEGFGSAAEWIAAAEAAAAGHGEFHRVAGKKEKVTIDANLVAMGLGEMPATKSELVAAFRKLAMKLHPDHNPGDKDAEAKFKTMYAAYEKLLEFFQ